MSTAQVEQHPLPPFLPSDSKVLVLGSFPPPRRRWSMDFYYPNLQNDFWRIIGAIFFDNKEHFISQSPKQFDRERIIFFLQEKGIAMYDTAQAVKRLTGNASDKDLEIVALTPIEHLLNLIPQCKAIILTGQKATDNLLRQITFDEPQIGHCSLCTIHGRDISVYRMPSTSRAYPLAFGKKVTCYRQMFEQTSII